MDSQQRLLLDLFTEIAIIEHLVRNRLAPEDDEELPAGQFGALNYFVRGSKKREWLATLAFAFQVTEDEMNIHLNALEARGLLRRELEGGRVCIHITPEGETAHTDAMARMAPKIAPAMEEFATEDLELTKSVLQEIRRTLDNLPDR